MKAIQLILITLTALSGCTKKDYTPITQKNTDTTTTTKPMTGPITYLALGDSYTVGERVPKIQSFPYQLTALLNGFNLDVQNPDVIAVTGWTTDDLINGISRSSFKDKKYTFVTLLIGVNDQYQGRSKDNYRTKFAQLLHTAIDFASGDTSKVFVVSIPDWGVTPFGGGRDSVIGPDIDAFNAINKEETAKAHVPNYIDINPVSKKAATDLTLVADDGLHPSGAMYKLWVDAILPEVRKRLQAK